LVGPRVAYDAFSSSVDKFWSNLVNVGRCDAPRCRLLIHDLKFLLLRFAKEESFSADSKGGGLESNLRIVPFFVHVSMFLLDHKTNPQRRTYEKTLASFLTQDAAHWRSSHALADNVLYMLVLSLIIQSLDEWKQSKLTFIKMLISYAASDYNASKSLEKKEKDEEKNESKNEDRDSGSQILAMEVTSSPPSNENMFKLCRPLMILFTLVDKLHGILKQQASTGKADGTQASSSAHQGPEWAVQMDMLIRNNAYKLQSNIKDLLSSYEEEWLLFEDFLEFFDTQDMLSDVLSEESPNCIDFVVKLFKIHCENIQ